MSHPLPTISGKPTHEPTPYPTVRTLVEVPITGYGGQRDIAPVGSAHLAFDENLATRARLDSASWQTITFNFDTVQVAKVRIKSSTYQGSRPSYNVGGVVLNPNSDNTIELFDVDVEASSITVYDATGGRTWLYELSVFAYVDVPLESARNYSEVIHDPVDVDTSTLPFGLPDDAVTFPNGGFSSNYPVSPVAEGETAPDTFYSTPPTDRMVRIDITKNRTWTDDNGYEHQSVSKEGSGDGITPFAIPPAPNPQFTSFNVDQDSRPGSYDVTVVLHHESGLLISDEYSYTVEGTDAAPFGFVPDPPPPPAVETVAMNALPADAPQELKDTAAIIADAPNLGTNSIGAAEAIWQGSGNHRAGVEAELDGYADAGEAWLALIDTASNENIKRVATLNEAWVFTHLFTLAMNAHNQQSNSMLAQVDQNVVRYEQYGNYAATATADNLKPMGEWLA